MKHKLILRCKLISKILKRNLSSSLYLTTGVLILTCTQLKAQDCSACNEALRKDVFKYSQNAFTYSKYLENITEHEYNELKRDLSTSATIPIPAISAIVKGSLDYSDFLKKIHDYSLKIEKEQFGSSQVDYEVYRTEPVAYEAWTKCMLECNGKSGVFLIKSYDTEATAVYTLKYRGAVDEPNVYYCRIEIVSEGKREIKNIILKKGGWATFTFERNYVNNRSESLITVNAREKQNSNSVSYSDNSKTIYVKPAGIMITALNYTYQVRESKLEKGPVVYNCMLPVIEPREPRQKFYVVAKSNDDIKIDDKEVAINQALFRSEKNKMKKGGTIESDFMSTDCGRPKGMSCDNKWVGYYSIIDIHPSPGYTFETGEDYISELKLEGPMAGWNGGQRCPKNDQWLINTPEYKQLKLWMHQDVNAHLEIPSYRESTYSETAFGTVDLNGKISFKIPNSRLRNYNIEIRLSDGTITNINQSNVNTLAYLNQEEDNTIFTLKRELK
ncbi:hypothetical protein [Mucilaginibacter kameinonensis]|uniref:hypothetical protein n=1 Tax=Mucilaginibacter kameinonensis TaxID=452286 RepID=UPI000EF78DD1|nr:hypothetical protein [Mucilaginibacter kameinonensis]